jgi:hypothetical protein
MSDTESGRPDQERELERLPSWNDRSREISGRDAATIGGNVSDGNRPFPIISQSKFDRLLVVICRALYAYQLWHNHDRPSSRLLTAHERQAQPAGREAQRQN